MNGDPEYIVPRYRARDGEAWFHFLHGNVPGHEIDFMYRPEVPQGALGRPHYSHLARLMRYIEPHDGAAYAFTVGNLSRDDTQHEPGHGGVAFIFGLRIRGATDHAGRPDPPFAHGIAAIDRALDAPALLAAAVAFHGRVLGGAASAAWYRAYVRAATSTDAAELERVLAGYVAGFDDLPRPEPSAMSLSWTAGDATPPGRVVVVYPDDAPFEVLAGPAARIAAVLYRSDVRWSAISNGREADLPNGTTVRFLPESAVGRSDSGGTLHAIGEIPEEPDAIARELFGAIPVLPARSTVRAWRDRGAVGEDAPVSVEIPITIEDPTSARAQALEPAARDEDAEDLVVAPAREERVERAGEGDEEEDAVTTQIEAAAVEPVPEVETRLVEALVAAPIAAPERPAVMIPIPIPLALVEPPPLSKPTSEPRQRPGLGRSRKKAAVVAGCFVAGVVAVVWVCAIPSTDPPALPPPGPMAEPALPPAPVPADQVAKAAAPTVATVLDPVVVASPTKAAVKASAGPTPASTGRRKCDVLGRPCF